MEWKVFLACAAGAHHRASAVPCQDAGHYQAIEGGVIGVVCDGAGSASQGHAGAQFLAQQVCMEIAGARKDERWQDGDGVAARALVLAVLQGARNQLLENALAQELSLRDFACTLVGCIATAAGGCFFHIGDGFGICRQETGQTVLSRPENGEYAEETYFVTDETWQEHLRLTPIPLLTRGAVIGLMSDGTAPFAVDRQRTGFFGPFIDPVVNFLRDASELDGNRALLGVLDDEKTLSITADDKTLLLALAG